MADSYINIHTHGQSSSHEVISVYNLMLNEPRVPIQQLFSAGLHPWFADQAPEDLLLQLSQLADHPNFFAYGETGLDKHCSVPFQLQQDIFKLHLEKAIEINKPVILHCVKAWDEMIEMTAGYPLPRILHGYNGSLSLTKRLVDKGFYFSIGKAITNPASKLHHSLPAIPLDQLFCETDDATISIQAIYEGVGAVLQLTSEELRAIIFANFAKIRSA
jgi:TatD DNase family protein